MAGDHTLIAAGDNPLIPCATDTDGNGDVWQRFKLGWGPDGSPADATASNPLPVVPTGTPALPTGASTEATIAAISTAMGRTAVVTDGSAKDWQEILQGYLVAGVPQAVDSSHPLPVVQTGTPALPTGAATQATLAAILALLPTALAAHGGLVVEGVASGVAIPISVASLPSQAVTNAGTFAVQQTQAGAATGAVAAFTATSSTVIFVANTTAKLRTIMNDSDKDLYVMLRAAAASTTAYHVRVAANGGFFHTDYTGEMRGILAGTIGAGQVNCGEFT